MTRIIANSGSKPTDKINGCAHEWAGVSVTSDDGAWVDRQGGVSLAHVGLYTNTSNEITLKNDAAGNFTSAGFLKSPQAGQKVILWLSAEFPNSTMNVRFGASAASDSAKVGRNTPEHDEGGVAVALVIPSFSIALSSTSRNFYIVFDTENGIGNGYDYDTSGVLQETKVAAAEGAYVNRQISFDQSSLVLPSENAAFKLKSFGLIYLDALPNNIQDLFSWMALNPTLGCHADLRYVD